MVGEARHEPAALKGGWQVLALDGLAREAVRTQGGGVVAHVLRLLLRHGQAQQAHLPNGLVGSELFGERKDVPLRIERARVHRASALRPVLLARVVVEGGHARDQEAAVAPARAARHGPRLEQHRLDAELRQPARA